MPMPMAVWTAISAELARTGDLRLLVAVLVSVLAYLRPCDMLKLRRDRLLPPDEDVKYWRLELSRDRRRCRGKQHESGGSICMEDSRFLFLNCFFRILKSDCAHEKVFPVTYSHYLRRFTEADCAAGAWSATPYAARASGACCDLALTRRELPTVLKRGRWTSKKRLGRFDAHRRLRLEWVAFSDTQRAHLEFTDAYIAELLLGRMTIPPPPAN